ncbi:hypothetical protein BDR22DRAFT_714159 [Usnea florida]
MLAEESEIFASLSRLEKLDKLKGASNYQMGKRKFEDELTILGMWDYVEEDYNSPVVSEMVTAERIKAWEQAHEKICTMFKMRCERHPRSMIQDETNAHKAWKTLEKLKPRGSGILNSTFRKFESITLAGCDNDTQTYTNHFMKVLREFRDLSPKLAFNEVWLVYHFHAGLGPVYNSYCERYYQTHDPFDENGDPKFDLRYAINRFTNTTTNPINSTYSSVETQALASLVNGTFMHTPLRVMALVASRGVSENKIQPGAHAGNSRTYVVTCKYCNHCKKDWHDDSECTTLHPHLKSRGKINRR